MNSASQIYRSFPLPFFPLRSERRFTLVEFEQFAFSDKELFIEYEADGHVSVLLPVSGQVGHQQAQLITAFTMYAREKGGNSLSSRMGYLLPDGSVRMCSASYVSRKSMLEVKGMDLNHFVLLVPDAVAEIVSPIRTLPQWQQRMAEVWIANGVKLAWLTDEDSDRLWIYRADHSVELVSPLDRTITGEDVLPGFTFDLNLLS
ncbi:MAG: Uma2 family endonuclease [Lewinella sp.]